MKNCQKSGKEQPAYKPKHHKIKLKISVTGVIRTEQHQHQGAANGVHEQSTYRVERHCRADEEEVIY